MRRGALYAAVLAAIAIPAGLLAQNSALEARLKAMTAEYAQAQQQYFAPLRAAKTDAERMKVRLDPAKHPARSFYPRFQALAKQAPGTKVELRALMWVVQNGDDTGHPNASTAVLTRLLTGFADDTEIMPALQFMRYGFMDSNPEKMKQKRAASLQMLRKLAARSKNREVKSGALFAVADILGEEAKMAGGSSSEAQRILVTIRKDYAGTRFAKQADAALFEVEHLQIGMAAPDFSATDEDGKPFKLSEYRGKVVVIDFWGFW